MVRYTTCNKNSRIPWFLQTAPSCTVWVVQWVSSSLATEQTSYQCSFLDHTQRACKHKDGVWLDFQDWTYSAVRNQMQWCGIRAFSEYLVSTVHHKLQFLTWIQYWNGKVTHDSAIKIQTRSHCSHTVIMWVIAICNVQPAHKLWNNCM